MSRKIEVEFTLSGLEKLRVFLTEKRKDAKELPEKITKEVLKEGESLILENMRKQNIREAKGELSRSIFSEQDKEKGVVGVQAEYAKFVEYGTGVVGKGSPHPDPPEEWEYDVPSEHKTLDGGWVYYDEHAGQFRFTYGAVSKPFMYHTYYDLRDRSMEIAKRIVGELIDD